MNVTIHCSKCNKEFNAADRITVMKYNNTTAYCIIKMTASLSDIVNNGEAELLCQDCMNSLKQWLKANKNKE